MTSDSLEDESPPLGIWGVCVCVDNVNQAESPQTHPKV